MRVAIYQYCLS